MPLAPIPPQESNVSREKVVYLGLAMSGAISAGAYSAGVLDFLIEALEEWEKAKKNLDDQTVPRHRVVIAGMAGASAGAITCAMGALSAALGARPVGDSRDQKITNGAPAFRVLPELYQAWVEYPTFFENSAAGTLLGSQDLDAILEAADKTKRQPITSVLNCEPLNQIGFQVMKAIGDQAVALTQRPYFPDRLHMFLTQTNSRGVPYKIEVAGDQGSGAYGMMCHLDRAHFTLANLGSAKFDSKWAGAERSYCFDVAKTSAPTDGFDSLWTVENTKLYIENTLASGAFPIGLEARELSQPIGFYHNRVWPVPSDLAVFSRVCPDWSWHGKFTPETYKFTALDGGAIDNDPFQFVRYTLMAHPPQDEPGQASEADRMVIMISPFPEPPQIGALPEGREDKRLSKVVSSLSRIFVQQSRFKLEEMLRSLTAGNAGLWRISPSRKNSEGETEVFAIACGLYGGFGGFLSRQFRDHDYELGRRNCQSFLRNWFGLPEQNDHIERQRLMPRFLNADGSVIDAGPETPLYPIVPLYGTAAVEVQVRDWPVISREHYQAFLGKAGERVQKFAEVLKQGANLTGSFNVKNWYLSIGAWAGGIKDKVREIGIKFTLMDLVRRDQILDEDQRDVLEVCMPTKLSTWLVSCQIMQLRSKITTSPMTIEEIYQSVKTISSIASHEFLAEVIADAVGLTARADIDQVEVILETDAPHYRTLKSIGDELNAKRKLEEEDEPPLAPEEIRKRVNELVGFGFLVERKGWYAAKRTWWPTFNWGTEPAYRFAGRSNGDTCE